MFKKIISIIFIIILFLLIIFGIMFFLNIKDNKKNTNKENKIIDNNKLLTTKEKAAYYELGLYFVDNMATNYINDNSPLLISKEPNDLDEKIITNNIYNYLNDYKKIEDNEVYSKGKIKEVINKLYDGYNYNKELEIHSECPSVYYDIENDYYVAMGQCIDVEDLWQEHVVYFLIEDKKNYLKIAKAYIEPMDNDNIVNYKVYKDEEKIEELGTKNNLQEVINTHLNQLDQYKINFKKKNNNYLFKNIEKIK